VVDQRLVGTNLAPQLLFAGCGTGLAAGAVREPPSAQVAECDPGLAVDQCGDRTTQPQLVGFGEPDCWGGGGVQQCPEPVEVGDRGQRPAQERDDSRLRTGGGEAGEGVTGLCGLAARRQRVPGDYDGGERLALVHGDDPWFTPASAGASTGACRTVAVQ